MQEDTIKAAYHRMTTERDWYLKEGKASAELTIPSIMPSDQDATLLADNETPVDIAKPWQSLGARGTRNLTSKMVLALFPPTSNFMRYQLHPQFKKELEKEERSEQRTEIERSLSIREQVISEDVERQNIRVKADQVIRHLLVVGNILIYMPPGDGGMRIFPLNNYVVRRDFVGNVVEIIYVEPLDKATLPDAVRDVLLAEGAEEDPDHEGELKVDKDNETVFVYTRIRLRGKRFFITQEANGHAIEANSGSVLKAKMPFLALRFVEIDGENYGRGYIEEFRGDLASLEQLRRSIVVASVNAAKLNPMIRPGAAITPKKLMEAENGQALFGRADDVVMLQQNKHADLSVAHQTSTELTKTLAAAFLLNSSFQRDAERVTREEIRRMVEELDDALGGFYSVLSEGFQLPIAVRTEDRLIKSGDLVELRPKDAVKIVIVTGLAAIGRGHEFSRLREYIAWLAGEVQPLVPDIGNMIVVRDLADRGAIGVGVNTEGLIKTDEQLQAERQQAQQAELRSTLLEGAAAPLGQVAADEIGGSVATQPSADQQSAQQGAQ